MVVWNRGAESVEAISMLYGKEGKTSKGRLPDDEDAPKEGAEEKSAPSLLGPVDALGESDGGA